MRKILFLFVGLSLLAACEQDKMDWGTDYDHPAAEDLPLELQEKIAMYDRLNSYTETTMGVAIDFNLYMTDESYAAIVNENFDQIVPGNELKMESIMNSKGELNFGTKMDVINALAAKGLTVYGHALVWHSQAQASYLNSLIKPLVIPGTAGESLIDGGFEDGMGGFAAAFNSQDYTIIESDTAIDGNKVLQATIGSGTTGEFDAQFNSPNFSVVKDHEYKISFWIRGDAPGKVRVDFNGKEYLGSAYPTIDGSELVDVGTSWTYVELNPDNAGNGTTMVAADNADDMMFRLLLGKVSSVVYQIDQISVVDLTVASSSGPTNLLTNGDFEAEDLSAWSLNNVGDGITRSADAKRSGSYGLKAIASATSANEWDLQFTPEAKVTLDPAKTYIFSFWVKSLEPASGLRVSFTGGVNGATNAYPWLDWEGTGSGSASFSTTSDWKQIGLEVTANPDGEFQPSFDFGKTAGATIYIDDIMLYDKAEEGSGGGGSSEDPDDLFGGVGFENGAGNWTGKYTASNYTIDSSEKHSGSNSFKAAVGSTTSFYDYEVNSPTFDVVAEHTYKLTFWMKSSGAGSTQLVISSASAVQYQYPNVTTSDEQNAGEINVGTEWIEVTAYLNATASENIYLRWFVGRTADTNYWVDDVKLEDTTTPAAVKRYVPGLTRGAATRAAITRAGPTTVPKTPEEKKAILEPVFIQYIKDVATYFKGKVAAWDVLNEAIDPDKPSQLREGVENLNSTNTFPWMLYLGKDYAVTAFKTAREADPSAKLFINDFGLESPGAVKLRTMLDYVAYIDSKSDGAPLVDGIGTQMHLNVNWVDKDAIREMFKLMAATGKLVKITELDVAIDSSTSAGSGPASPLAPTLAQYQTQADIYNYVVKTYMEEVPAAQRFGITVWGVRDRVEEHAYWLPNDMPFLFDTDNGRKLAYKAFCDGLAGRDVSADWTYGDMMDQQ